MAIRSESVKLVADASVDGTTVCRSEKHAQSAISAVAATKAAPISGLR